MKRNLLSNLIGIMLLGMLLPGNINAQTLKHAYTFDDGTANDTVGTLNGTLNGGSISIANGKCTVSGATGNTDGYISLDAAALALNTYTAVTLEAYIESADGANGSYTMLAYFGNNTGGNKCLWIQPTRSGNESRIETNNGSVTKTAALPGTEIDDGKLHHVVAVLTGEALKYYLDGDLVAETATDTATNGKFVSNLDNVIANIFKGPDGWADPNYNASLDEFNIYDGELSAEDIFNHADKYVGPTSSQLKSIVADTGTLKPTFNPSDTLYYLIRDAGVTTVNITATPKFSGSVVTGDGAISITGDIDTVTITVASEDASDTTIYTVYIMEEPDCYTPLYLPDADTNLVPDPECTDLSLWNGWGNRSIYYNYDSAYCGISCAMLEAPGAGCEAALDISGFTWKPNTTYRLHVMVKTIGGSIGFLASSTDPNFGFAVDTKGEWMLVDTMFTTGASAGTNFFSFNTCDYGSNCTKTYIDNYELYEVSNNSTLSDLTLSISALDEQFNPSDTVYSAIVPQGTDTVFVYPTPTIDSAYVTAIDTVVLSGGTGTSEIVVTSVDSSSTTTYTINFTEADGNNYAIYLPGSDGLSSNIDISGLNLTTLPYTIEMWIKPDGDQADYAGLFMNPEGNNGVSFVGWQASYDALRLNASGGANFGGTTLTGEVISDKWHHVAAVVTDTTRTLYLDGVPYSETATFAPCDWTAGHTFIGWYFDITSRVFKGIIDDVRIWNVKRDSATIVDNKFTQYQGDEAGLLGLWNFDLQNPTYAVDLTTDNKLHGIITGGNYVPSFDVSDASLSALSTDVGTLDPVFSSSVYSYDIAVPHTTTSVTITATANQDVSTVSGDGTIDISSSTTLNVVVTAGDGTQQTYTINVTVEPSGIEDVIANTFKVYPTVSSGKFYVSSQVAAGTITIYDVAGHIVQSREITSTIEMFNISKTGVYLIQIDYDNTNESVKLIVK